MNSSGFPRSLNLAIVCIAVCAAAGGGGYVIVECPSVGEVESASDLEDAGGHPVLEGTARPEVITLPGRALERTEISDNGGRKMAIGVSLGIFAVLSILAILCLWVAPKGSNWRVVGVIVMVGVVIAALFASLECTSYCQDARAVLSRDDNAVEVNVVCWSRLYMTINIPLDASPRVYQCSKHSGKLRSYSVGVAWYSGDTIRVLWLMSGIKDTIDASELASKVGAVLDVPVIRNSSELVRD